MVIVTLLAAVTSFPTLTHLINENSNIDVVEKENIGVQLYDKVTEEP